jgi:hypothetical protein
MGGKFSKLDNKKMKKKVIWLQTIPAYNMFLVFLFTPKFKIQMFLKFLPKKVGGVKNIVLPPILVQHAPGPYVLVDFGAECKL